MAGHFGDEFALGLVDGLFGLEEAVEQVVVLLLLSAEPATQTVLDAIAREDFTAGGGRRTGTLSGIGAVGREFAF